MKKLLVTFAAIMVSAISSSAFGWIVGVQNIYYNPQNSTWSSQQQTPDDIRLKNKRFVGSGGFSEYYFENGKLVESSKKVLSLKNHEELLDFMHNNPDDFVVQMAKKSDILPTLKNATQNDDIDYRKYIDFDEFKGVAEKLDKLKNKFEEFKQANVKEKTLDAFLDNVKKLKRRSILKNMGACIGALGILAPALMIAFRKFDKDNNAFQVKEDLKKELQAKGKI